MSKKKEATIITLQKAVILKAMENTYDDSKFFIGRGIPKNCDFTKGYYGNRTELISKDDYLDEIKACKYDRIGSIPDFPDYLVLGPRTFFFSQCISDNQIYHTDAPDDFFHAINSFNPHLEVYVKIDKKNMTISFLLGDHQKTLPLEVRSGHSNILHETKLCCSSVDSLDESFRDKSWNHSFITIGRMALGINECLFFKQ